VVFVLLALLLVVNVRDRAMILSQASIIAVPILMACSLVLLIGYGWRGTQIALSIQYLAVFWLVTLSWPIGMAAVKLVVGLMASAVLATPSPAPVRPTPCALRASFSAAWLLILVWIVIFSVSPSIMSMTHVGQETSLGSLVLMSMGAAAEWG